MSYSGTKTVSPDETDNLTSDDNPYRLTLPDMELEVDEEPRGRVPFDQREKDLLKPIAMKLRLDGYSYAQIAEQVDKSKDTVKKWIKQTLRERQQARDDLGDLIIQYAVDGIHRVKQNVLTLVDQIDRIIERKENDRNEEVPAALLREKRQALKDLLSVNKEFRNLLGLDAPEKTIHEHQGGMEFDLNITPPEEQDYDEVPEQADEPIDAEYEEATEPEALPEETSDPTTPDIEDVAEMTQEIDQKIRQAEQAAAEPLDDET